MGTETKTRSAAPAPPGNPIRASILPIALLYWASFVILTSVSAVLRGYDYGWINLPLDFSLIVYATLAALLIARLIAMLKPLGFARQAIIALAGIAAGTFLFDLGFQLIRSQFGPQAAELSVAAAATPENILRGGLFWFVPLCLWAAAMLALLNNEKARDRERELFVAQNEASEQLARAAEAETRAARLELDRLRLQLNPHFIGNSLNAISTLILAGRVDEADAAVGSLADFLRSAMESSDRLIRLAEEIETLRAYLKIEAIRFGGRLDTQFEVGAEAADALLPNFILQPLVENAVKYAVGTSRHPVRIRIAAWRDADQLLVSVEDNGSATAQAKESLKSGGVGLANTRARLQLHYGSAAALYAGPTGSGWRSTIRLPFQSSSAPG